MFKLDKNTIAAKVDKNIWRRSQFSPEGTWLQYEQADEARKNQRDVEKLKAAPPAPAL